MRIKQKTSTNLIYLFLITIFFSSCYNSAKITPSKELMSTKDFPNILNYKGVPDSALDRSVYAYSDLGTWHGYALPTKVDKQLLGSFIGPYIMTQDNGIWLSEALTKVEIINSENGEVIDLSKAKIFENNSYPNQLTQVLQIEKPNLFIQTQLIFISNRTALIKVAIQNKSQDKNLRLAVRWSGDSFLEEVRFSKEENGIRVNFGKNENIGWISTPNIDDLVIDIRTKNYSVQLEDKILQPNEILETYLTQTFCFSEQEKQNEMIQIAEAFHQPATIFKKNQTNWDNNLQSIIPNLDKEFNTPAHQRIAVKCLQTLKGNWKSAAGFLKHDGLFPSYNYEWFNGFWSWDSWKHAVAIAPFDSQLAQNQIRAMYDFQDEMGMIADCVYRDTIIENHNWRDTKPPLSAWATWEVFQHSKDEAFLKELFPKIEKYHNWWYQYRDIDKNGLCEYGSTDNSLVAAKWESGMDNAVRFDNTKMIPNQWQGGSMNRESVDLNAYLFAEKKYLAKMAAYLGKEKEAQVYQETALQLQSKIHEMFYDEESGWFYDIDLETKKHLKVYGAEGWIPLWTKAATPEQAARVRETMLDTTKFFTFIPFPTLAADHPKFKPKNGYWRGPVWLDQAYFAIEGLRNYGYEADAIKSTHRLFDRLEGLKDSDLPIRENYHPLTGEGMESQHFSWSAAHLLMLLTE